MNLKPTTPQTIAGIRDPSIYEAVKQLRDALNSILGAFSLEMSTTTPSAANTDFTLTHNLGRIPTSWLVTSKGSACDIYTGSMSATETTLTLRGTVANVAIKIVLL